MNSSPAAVTRGPTPRVGLVLSGGGVRGAYVVGVVAGIVEALGLGPGDPAPFHIFTGTSVGAINASFLASNTHRGDMNVDRLVGLWSSLELNVHLRLEVLERWRRAAMAMAGSKTRSLQTLGRLLSGHPEPRIGWSLLDAAPIERLVTEGIDWDGLRHNLDAGRSHALIITALEVASGRTTMFADLAASARFEPSRDPSRQARYSQITPAHVLASAAIPVLFPTRRIEDSFYCDGGLRFNTPIAPAIRAGAERLVVIPLLRGARRPVTAGQAYPGLTFLAGKLLNALLTDPVDYDLQVLERLNRLVEILERTLNPGDLAQVQSVLSSSRGAGYRRLEPLVIRPSEDIGVLAGEYLRHNQPGRRLGGPEGWLLRYLRWRTRTPEADWASYVLFDGGFAETLIDLGRRDARAQRDEIIAFFGEQAVLSERGPG